MRPEATIITSLPADVLWVSFATEALARRINKVLFGEFPPKGLTPFLPFLTEKLPPSFTSYCRQMVPVSHT